MEIDRESLLAHIAAIESEWPKCKHGHPIRISGGSFLANWMSRSCEYCGCFEGLGDTADEALAAFRAANQEVQDGK